MRVMVMVKVTQESEAGAPPSLEAMETMGQFNEELIKAGILLSAEGLKATSQGVRINMDGASRIVTDGPFAETKELIAGFQIWQVRDMKEAVEWVNKFPNPTQGVCDIEMRPLFEIEDFAKWDETGDFAAGVEDRRAQVKAKE